ncbi:exonuclease domain-containing protein [Paenibacillus filicis]|uniref:Exonuclease domain-containing protein n=1 Tax=Paenibacillus gyeongsangnamensis TaxID=3388067 RepID=A0ABT4QLV8_9BACL|nr:3'-5' exonuclease [Paenibacillus filicis]MCZ8517845.1 exonuclease domain-containing protein [Paenibacillus filicis]
MNYIVLDLEFNGRRHYNVYPMEIIEIGAVKLNEKLEVIDTFQSYIRPLYPINQFALQFCRIPKTTLLNSDPFTKVISRFIDFCGTDYTMLAWGGSDFFNLFVDCKVNNVASDWLVNLLDFTSFFEGGLQQALAEHSLSPIGQHHSALDDALNAAQLLKLKPDLLQSEKYFVPNHFKICTGGIKKWISLCLEQAKKQGKILTWDSFKEDDKTKTYFSVMHLTPEEINMVKTLFNKFFSMTYGRKSKKLQTV